MAPSPVIVFFWLLMVSAVGWVVFMFAARLIAWLLSRILGASVGFRVTGLNSARDVVLKFKKGGVESVFVGEVKISLRKSLVKLGWSFISKDPKLQVLITDLEIVLRRPEKTVKKVQHRKSQSASRGKWILITNVSRLVSISVTELTVKIPKGTIGVPKAAIEVKDLKLDIFKGGGAIPNLSFKLQLLPFLVNVGEWRLSYDLTAGSITGGNILRQTYPAAVEKIFAPFSCEELSLFCELGHDRESGVVVKNLDVTSGEVLVNLKEDLFQKKSYSEEPFLGGHANVEAVSEPLSDTNIYEPISASKSLKTSNHKGSAVLSVKKYISRFPEKVSFNMPKLDVRFMHEGQRLLVENNIMGIQLRSSKSQSSEDLGESTSHFDIQVDFSEIHLLREEGKSVLEILKVVITTSFYVPTQLTMPLRAEVDIKLGGTQCNILTSRLKPWMFLYLAKERKGKSSRVLPEGKNAPSTSPSTDMKAIMWTCTVSAPEMTIVLYGLNGLPLYHGCSQSSHLFANNITSTKIAVHMELGELHLHIANEYHECLKESLFGVETNTGSLMHIARVSLDWGHKEVELSDEENSLTCWKPMFVIDITGMGLYFTYQRLESIISTTLFIQEFSKCLSNLGKKSSQKSMHLSNKKPSKGGLIIKLNLERCSVNLCGEVSMENAVVADPKRVNFGSQGGVVVISGSADGTPRSAKISCMTSGERKELKFTVSLDIFHFALCINKEKQFTQMELERARSVYEELSEESKVDSKVTLLDMQNAKFVRRSGGANEVAVCSLFSATDISVRWEPDVHLSFYEFGLRLKSSFLCQKCRNRDEIRRLQNDFFVRLDGASEKEAHVDLLESDKHHKKKELVFAIDVEMLSLSADLADGVEAFVQVQSIFSENARIGVLLEGLTLSLNEARVFKSSRMQISRIPTIPTMNSSFDAKVHPITTWDCVIQGFDVHICMPYRLQLRAIEDAVEDMWRGLKLIMSARRSLLFPMKKEGAKPSKNQSTKFGSVKFGIRKITAEIEEEPIQGWLDEHYQMMKTQICEQDVRLKFLDEIVSEGLKCGGNHEPNEQKQAIGSEIDPCNGSSVKNLREEIQKQAFQSYYQACQKLVKSDGSGACKRGFQAGFKRSTARTSLLSLSVTELDVTLTAIEGGHDGMIDLIKTLDPAAMETNVPFSRLLGRHIVVHTGSLVLQLRNFTYPLLSTAAGKCEGGIVFAQQATCFQPQILQDVFIGKWRRVAMLRSASGTTPPMKMYSELPLYFEKAEVSFGVGFEPAFADVSYAFTVALRKANLSTRNFDLTSQAQNATVNVNTSENQPPKKERSLPWWDDMRYYIHGKNNLSCSELRWNILATTDPYEKIEKLHIVSGYTDIQQSDGRILLNAKDFRIFLSSLERLINNYSIKLPADVFGAFLQSPTFTLEVTMDWACESGSPLNHYLHAFPNERQPRKKVYDPFRSTSLSLRWNFLLRPSGYPFGEQAQLFGMLDSDPLQKSENNSADSPIMNLGAHDLIWIFRWWNMNYNPPHKLRSFSRWPRFGIPRVARSGNLSLDKVMTECMLRVDATPTCIKHVPLVDDDPAHGLTFRMTKLKYELGYSRGRQRYTFDCKRDPLDLVYQGLDLHMLKAEIKKRHCACISQDNQKTKRSQLTGFADRLSNGKCHNLGACSEKHSQDGFLLSSDYFTIRRQAPKADPTRLLAWQEAGRRNLETTYVRSEFENGSESDHTRSDPSDDDGFNVVIADNCQRVFVYGLKLLWTLENRDAVWSWVGEISKAFESPKPSPSRQYAQRKLMAKQQAFDEADAPPDEAFQSSPTPKCDDTNIPSPLHGDSLTSSPLPSVKMEGLSSGAVVKHGGIDDSEEEGTRHFMVNVIQPQFNLHSEDANGRFLLAAASGRVLARSFHSVVHVGYEMIQQALGTGGVPISGSEPEMTWKRVEFNAMLEHVQAHVAPTDVDPGAGLQWLPRIPRSSPKVKRTGALLERVFMPCTMYFRYTRHKGGTADLKMKPLKELAFNSPNITATMTSRQFQVMLDILSNLLFARLPKPRKSSLSYPADEDEDVEEEADEVVPEGVEEVELARINLEQAEREQKLILDDIRTLAVPSDTSGEISSILEKYGDLWMITSGKSVLVQCLKKELGDKQMARKAASVSLRLALQKAAHLRLMEKEKNKSPSYAMRISLRINKVVWSMLADGKSFAEAEINNMNYDFDRDYKDIGVAQFTTKSFVVRNCMPNVKSDMLLSAWNPPPEWGRNVMLRVDAKQGAPKDGSSPLELFQVEIYPLKIHLTETMYRMMWDYFFPEEEQDSQRRQEVWKVSTTAGSRRGKKNISLSAESVASSSRSVRESEVPIKHGMSATPSMATGLSQSSHGDVSQGSKLQNLKANMVCGTNSELRRTSSFDKNWEENVAESVAVELVLQVHSASVSNTKSESLNSSSEHQYAGYEDTSKSRSKDPKPTLKSGRFSHEEKKVGRLQDEKRSKGRKTMEFHNIKISQVELLVTYEGSRFAVNDLRLLMDTFTRVDFTGTWRRLFSRVKKHIIWGVLKSVTGMQGKKFKDKVQSQRQVSGGASPDSDLNFSDSDGGQNGKSDQYTISWFKRPSDGAGDGFVTSIRGLFNSQRRRAKAFVLRTMRGDAENEFQGEWSESDAEFSPFARQLTITKAKRLIRRHTKKFRTTRKGVSQQRESVPSSPRATPFDSDSSNASSPYEDFHE
ncbi:hypothetical protein AMTRI_Chr13g123910 [Amborella trichopoda]